MRLDEQLREDVRLVEGLLATPKPRRSSRDVQGSPMFNGVAISNQSYQALTRILAFVDGVNRRVR